MFLGITSLILLGLVLAVGAIAFQFASEPDGLSRKWFLLWCFKGALVPVIIWFLMNAGSHPLIPPLNHQIQRMITSGNPVQALVIQTWHGAWCVALFWTILSFTWYWVAIYRCSPTPEDLVIFGVLTGLVAAIPSLLTYYLFGPAATGMVIALWTMTLALHALHAFRSIKKAAPAYSRAIGKIKFGKYAEAEQVIIAELEKCHTDFDGWMMLSELYANQFQDLAEAERSILELIEDPATTLPQVSIALNKLADWHLVLRKDPDSARRVLQMICDRMPDTLLARNANNRIQGLPANRTELEELHHQRVISLPHMEEGTASPFRRDPTTPQFAQPKHPELLETIRVCVEQLTRDPNDVATREELARLYAEELGQFDAGAAQLALLIAMPRQDAAKIPGWIMLMGQWHAREHGHDTKFREILHRLIEEYPQSKKAFDAQRHLSILQTQDRVDKRAKSSVAPPSQSIPRP